MKVGLGGEQASLLMGILESRLGPEQGVQASLTAGKGGDAGGACCREIVENTGRVINQGQTTKYN